MKAEFTLITDAGEQSLVADISQLVVAGWAGRDRAAIDHHIEELAAIGVPRPSTVPLYYRIGHNQLTQEETVQVLGGDSSGEVETFVFAANGELFVSISSDHTDRKLESVSVAFSKQACIKPVGRHAWRHADVAEYWDELVVRAWIEENGERVLYQEGTLDSLQNPLDLIAGYVGGKGTLPDGTGMTCGTMGAIGGIRPSAVFDMELFDPRRNRSIRHRYVTDSLPVIA